MEGNGKEGKGVQGETSVAKKTDEEFMAELVADPIYSGIDVMREHGKMIRWCEQNRKKPSRKRFVNWLNNTEKPMNGIQRRPEANMVQETLKVREL